MPRYSKYRVDMSESGKAKRTYKGKVYASQAERRYAEMLDAEVEQGRVVGWVRQPQFQLGEDFTYRADFLVVKAGESGNTQATEVVDVKGVETTEFRRVKRLWRKYGMFPLRVVSRGRTTEVVHPEVNSKDERAAAET